MPLRWNDEGTGLIYTDQEAPKVVGAHPKNGAVTGMTKGQRELAITVVSSRIHLFL
jgi:hypothetical protein